MTYYIRYLRHCSLPSRQRLNGTNVTICSTAHSPLPTLHSPLPTLHSPLPTAHCPLSTLHCPLPTAPRGLATLELVLALPILLMCLALIVNIGTMACWKIRSECVARHAVWGARWPRTGSTNPRPAYWPETAGISATSAGSVPELDIPLVPQEVARGPLPPATVNQLLDPSQGLSLGSATLHRGFAMLGKLGSFNLEADNYLLDNPGQYERMGLGSNNQRRINVLYQLPRVSPALVTAYVNAFVAIYFAPFRQSLAPLDKDDEFIQWQGRAPSFYPQLSRFCDTNPETAKKPVEALIERIKGAVVRDDRGRITRRVADLAHSMAGSFINMYQRAIKSIQDQSAPDPPPPVAQEQIDQLQKKIDTLQKFLSRS
jgi:hypothetical protein